MGARHLLLGIALLPLCVTALAAPRLTAEEARKACDAGEAVMCLHAALLMSEPSDLDQFDLALAYEYADRACDLRVPDGCNAKIFIKAQRREERELRRMGRSR
ncbi:MAG: hypothetical protein K6A65_06640 [Succinivibrionaceae bacterium]|nr:hypothetical protein [Succinivibrionaceae bacterium]